MTNKPKAMTKKPKVGIVTVSPNLACPIYGIPATDGMEHLQICGPLRSLMSRVYQLERQANLRATNFEARAKLFESKFVALCGALDEAGVTYSFDPERHVCQVKTGAANVSIEVRMEGEDEEQR